MTRPLDGIRVLDVSDSIGAYCTKLLAGLGADVIKVEYPEGDELRRRPPFRDGATGSEASLVFAYYHADKRGITLDTRHAESLPELEALGKTADVVVMSPSRRRPLAGFDEDTLAVSWAPDDAVVCAITPVRAHGTVPASARHALRGRTRRAGRCTRSVPRRSTGHDPGQQHWDEASRARRGVHPRRVAELRRSRRPDDRHLGARSGRRRATSRSTGTTSWAWRMDRTSVIGYPPTGTWQCKDGPFDVAAHQTRHWNAFLRMLDDPAELSDPSLERRPRPPGDLRRSRRDDQQAPRGPQPERARRAGPGGGLPCSILNTPGEFVEDEQLAARRLLRARCAARTVREVRMPGAPFRSSPELFAVASRRALPRRARRRDASSSR